MSSTLEALQSTLAGEHAAVWTYGTLGGQTSESKQPELFEQISAAFLVHRERRDQLIADVRELGVQPVASAAAYRLPNDLANPRKINAAARQVEQRSAAGYADLIANTHGAQRVWAIAALNDAAVRELGFRGSPEIFPGMTEFTDR